MKLSLKRILLIAFLVLIAVFLVIVFIILDRPTRSLTEAEKQEALLNILGRPVQLTDKSVPTGSVIYQGKYYTFMYPKAATKYESQLQQNSYLEGFKFDLADPKIYTVTEVDTAPSPRAVLSDNTGVRIRLIQNDIYREATISADNQTGLSFEKNNADGVEKTGFFLVNGRYYSFSFNGSDQQAIEALFQEVISTLKFL
jgi:hypothetical protein